MCSIAFVIQLRMPSSSFLPAPYSHHYPIAKTYSKSVAYLSCEFAIDQSFKIYAGGLGFLAGSHMRSAADLGQNLAGVGILWTYGYYNQVRGDEGELAVQFRKQHYSFLQETGIRFTVDVHGHPVWVRAYHLPGEVFGTVPMFFLSTDVDENDFLSRQITHRLYDNDELRRIAQYMILGIGAAKLFDVLGVSPEIMHLNEAHGLSAAFHLLKKHGNLEEVRNRLVFTTHTPEEAGNEKHHFSVLRDFGFFSGLDEPWVRDLAGVEGDVFNHTLAALRMAKKANGVSKLHGQVSRKMWKHARGICEITHVTNAQNKKFWADHGMERARVDADADALTRRKRELKSRLFRIVADQTGKLFDTGILTLVWARRFAGYKRPDLITRDLRLFREMLGSSNYPVQIIWAGKPYPFDDTAIQTFNHLIQLTKDHPNATVLTGYELELSRSLKYGADLWLNNPVVTREASGTSGMSAAMNGAVNFSTLDGWICEFAKDGENSFIIPPVAQGLSHEDEDRHDLTGFYAKLNGEILPLYYDHRDKWNQIVLNSMNDVVPYFDSDRMVREYYEVMYR
ncbi:MAG: alpha-glucan family phosphorylase [Verrucomicrobiota bacterium]